MTVTPIRSLDFRRFCRRHGILRNERAGRPRKREQSRNLQTLGEFE